MTHSEPVSEQVRQAYDTVAAKYADQFADELRYKPLDRALLAAFAEQVRHADPPGSSGGPVADIGCGPGHITAHLAGLGLNARGIDLSPAMIELARRRYPGLHFAVGQMPGLPFADGELAGAVLFYSIIHLTPDQRAATFAELARMLRPGGLMVLAFHIGHDEILHVDNWFGESVSFDGYKLSVQTVADEVAAAGLNVEAILTRAPFPPAEILGTWRCYLQARRPVALAAPPPAAHS